MASVLVEAADRPVPVYLFTLEDWQTGQADLAAPEVAFAKAQGFSGQAGKCVLLADAEGALSGVLFGLGGGHDGLALAALSQGLPPGAYKIEKRPQTYPMAWCAAGWADGAYRFTDYLKASDPPPCLVVGSGPVAEAMQHEADAVSRLRDLVNTPAGDMGPDRVALAVEKMAGDHGADVEVIVGDDLLVANYPMVHAVGRAARVAPRFIELSWGDPSHPELALIGKGVTFDTGGLNIKTGDFMRQMKKDMGGAAHAIALADLVMAAKLPVRLKLYVPTAENAIGGDAFRPGDILKSRKGLTVEIDNTDAEGRLILADALARASEGAPDLIIDFATLTGAARVAVGPDLAPFYTDDEQLAGAIMEGGAASGDPVWRMPLWAPYMRELASPIADLVNSGGRMAGSITAALFLKEFVDAPRWVHLDVWAWRLARYGRPQGGAACGLRAIWAMLQSRYAES